ncbi:MAG: N-acetylglutaminylglutamine synthetase [Bradymonadales bacterium]|nr:MAG: N-acetylglutaminylglutamine synthetase [Bradymonadales bacterium]
MRKPSPRKHKQPDLYTSSQSWKKPRASYTSKLLKNAVIDCGWGQLLFGQTFESQQQLAESLCKESKGRRNIALYLRDPHVILNLAPLELFLDPSHSFRMRFENYRPSKNRPKGFSIRRVKNAADFKAINKIYKKRQMVPINLQAVKEDFRSRVKTWLVVQENHSKKIIGSVLGVDHVRAFKDPEGGSSLWSLAVDPDTHCLGIGEALVRYLIEHYQARGRSYMDLSVMHNNSQAIALYEKLGFERVPVFCVKHKNAINEPLFTAPMEEEEKKLNAYAKIIVQEARRRGVVVKVSSAERSLFQLSFGGRHIHCQESLTEMTSAISYLYCADKSLTNRILQEHGLQVPDQIEVQTDQQVRDFVKKFSRVVVKPVDSEQGRGVSVDLRSFTQVKEAIQKARKFSQRVLVEEFREGQDLRVVVIDYKTVAASLRVPPRILGTGSHSIRQLIEKRNRRTIAATGGESKVPLDEETERCLRQAGWSYTDILPEAEELEVRKTANLHTGGSMIDVTDQISKDLKLAAEKAAKALFVPVVGLDFLIESVDSSDYVIVEANERPGLANHEPQPTAERFIDLLFPQTKV